jgi:hypothetical protein
LKATYFYLLTPNSTQIYICSKIHNDSVYEAVRSSGLIDHSSLEDTNEQHLQSGKSLAEALIDAELTTRDWPSADHGRISWL